MKASEEDPAQATTYRFVTFAVGELFIALALIAYVESDRSTSAVVGVLVIAGLGLEAIISACFGRKSMLARIWPFH